MRFVYEKGKKVSELVKKYNADYGFNFPFFYNGIPLGDVEDNDKVINAAYGKLLKWHEFASVNGKPVIGQLNKNDNQDFLVQGSPLLIENGKLVYEFYTKYDETASDIAHSRCQRTCVGIDKDGNLIVVVCDGRTKENKGLSIKELALFMKSKGCLWALNGDGGGSSTLCTKNGIVNQNKERVVHHAILIFNKER
jgi:exopolysaccharide biosynthesis protein